MSIETNFVNLPARFCGLLRLSNAAMGQRGSDQKKNRSGTCPP